MKKTIPINLIRIDGGTQQRTIDSGLVEQYAELMLDDVIFPPVDVLYDGKEYWLWNGFHRYHAALKVGKVNAGVNCENGTQRQAVWLSFSANKDNGLPRQQGTVKEILEKILADEKWAKTSQHKIAEHVGCTQQFVSKIIAEFKSASDNQLSDRNADSKPNTWGNAYKNVETKTIKRGNSTYEMKPKAEPKITDSVGREVPEHLVDIFKRADEFRETVSALNAILRKAKDAIATGDKLYAYIKIENLEAEIGNVKRIFRFGLPFAVCIYCGADETAKDCSACGGRGFLNERLYQSAPEELKK